jgi:hypothetical protein
MDRDILRPIEHLAQDRAHRLELERGIKHAAAGFGKRELALAE